MILLAKTMALELAPRVRVNAICPGYVLTPMQEAEYTAEMLAAVDAKIPLGRHARPEELAGSVRVPRERRGRVRHGRRDPDGRRRDRGRDRKPRLTALAAP